MPVSRFSPGLKPCVLKMALYAIGAQAAYTVFSPPLSIGLHSRQIQMTRNVGKSVWCSAPPTLCGPGTYGSEEVQQTPPGWDRDRDIKVPAMTSIVGVFHFWKYQMNPMSEITHLHPTQRLLLTYGGINNHSNKSCVFFKHISVFLYSTATCSTLAGHVKHLKWWTTEFTAA